MVKKKFFWGGWEGGGWWGLSLFFQDKELSLRERQREALLEEERVWSLSLPLLLFLLLSPLPSLLLASSSLFCVSLPLTVIQRDTVTDGISMPQPIRAPLRGLLGTCGGLIGCPVPCLPACLHVCVYVHVCTYVCVPSVPPPLLIWDQPIGQTHQSAGASMSVTIYIYVYDTTTHGDWNLPPPKRVLGRQEKKPGWHFDG